MFCCVFPCFLKDINKNRSFEKVIVHNSIKNKDIDNKSDQWKESSSIFGHILCKLALVSFNEYCGRS